jgi:hypothetical protein
MHNFRKRPRTPFPIEYRSVTNLVREDSPAAVSGANDRRDREQYRGVHKFVSTAVSRDLLERSLSKKQICVASPIHLISLETIPRHFAICRVRQSSTWKRAQIR